MNVIHIIYIIDYILYCILHMFYITIYIEFILSNVLIHIIHYIFLNALYRILYLIMIYYMVYSMFFFNVDSMTFTYFCNFQHFVINWTCLWVTSSHHWYLLTHCLAMPGHSLDMHCEAFESVGKSPSHFM